MLLSALFWTATLATPVNQCFAPPICKMPPLPVIEQYLLDTPIKYQMWWNWPVYYDCGGILTEAYKQDWYKGEKINSRFEYCIRWNPRNAQPWDVLVIRNEPRHVALITSKYSHGTVEILDYYEKKTTASYRLHGIYAGIEVLSKDCLMSLK